MTSLDLLAVVVAICVLGALAVSVRVLRSRSRLLVVGLIVCAAVAAYLRDGTMKREIAAHEESRDHLCASAEGELRMLAQELRDPTMTIVDPKVDMGDSARSWAKHSVFFCLGLDAHEHCGRLLTLAEHAATRSEAAELIDTVATALRTNSTCPPDP